VSVNDWFAASYAEAKGKFLDAAKGAGAELTSHPHPLKGPAGEDLALDVARLGPADAGRVLVTSSATHGIEGFCGSGCQVGFLESGLHRELPAGTALLHVHAHNPHGFAHQRRVTEDNVDLNRNFIDFSAPPPANPDYDEVHPWLVPASWEGPDRQAADAAILGYIEERGLFAFQAAVSGGQWGHPDGLFFGGQAPTWSRRTIEATAGAKLAGTGHVALIDFHTGLGPRGHGELIAVGAPGSAEHKRTLEWYGDAVKSPEAGDSVSAVVKGTIEEGYGGILTDTEATTIAIEYGTLPAEQVLQALRADNWLHLHGQVDSALGREIKTEIRAAFYGEDKTWCEDVWEQANALARQALRGLAES
jgi:hypothetical protein